MSWSKKKTYSEESFVPGGGKVHRDLPLLIIDGSILFREGLRRILYEAGFQCVWCSDQPPVAPLRAIANHMSPLIIIGTDLDEAEVQIREMKRMYPTCRVVMLLNSANHDQLGIASHSGADAFLLKSTSCETLLSTLPLVMDGFTVLPSELADALMERRELPTIIGPTGELKFEREPPPEVPQNGFGLSNRELAVLWCGVGVCGQLGNSDHGKWTRDCQGGDCAHGCRELASPSVRHGSLLNIWTTRRGLLAT